jgi:hypothetical protein
VGVALAEDSTPDKPDEITSEPTAAAAQADVLPGIQKGATVWGLGAGFGVVHQIWGGRGEGQFLTLGARIGRVLTGPTGPGALRGNLDLSAEILPVVIAFQKPTAYGLSFTLLFRHYLAPASKVRPFISLGAGALYSTADIPADTTQFNFTPQGGVGVIFFPSRRVGYTFEYRIVHISNGGRVLPNPGVNSSSLQFGVSLFR